MRVRWSVLGAVRGVAGVRGVRGAVLAGAWLFALASTGACGSDEAPAAPQPNGSAGGGGKAGGAGNAGIAGQGAAAGASGCTKPSDCAKVLSSPEGCAEAECTAGKCSYRTVDADGDGHRTRACARLDKGLITLGDDCDDASKDVFPGAWDGPADGAKPNRCNDGVDQDCSGTVDDGKTDSGATCTCVPGDTVACAEDASGKPISFPGGSPVGACKRGAAKCGTDGKLGPCVGAQGPTPELCNGADDDCDGQPDNLPGSQLWFYDGDGDYHAAKGWKPIVSCQQPKIVPPECGCVAGAPCKCDASKWQIALNPDDCDDSRAAAYPGAAESCNGLDDNCNGTTDEGVPPSTDKCEVGFGPCKRAGTKTCEGGSYQGCSVAPGEGTSELCDGVDNDCDGLVDNAVFAGKQVADAACFECISLGLSTTLSRGPGDEDFGGSVYVSTKLLVDDVGTGPNQRRVRVVGALEEKQGDGTVFTYGGSQTIVAKRAIKRVLTQDATGTYGYGNNGFGGFQLPQLIELGQITDTAIHTYTVPLQAKTGDGNTYAVEPLVLTVLGDSAGNDFPGLGGGSYVNPAAACIWVELEK